MTDFDARGGCDLSSLGSSECHRERPGDASEGPGLPGPDDKGPGCHVLPQRSWATNPKYLFLCEIGGGSCLKTFLDIVIMNDWAFSCNAPRSLESMKRCEVDDDPAL